MNKSNETKILEPYKYVCQFKELKSNFMIIKAFNYWIAISNQELIQIEDISSKVIYSLILDNALENDISTYNGFPSTHLIYGVPSTLNCCNHLRITVLKKILDIFPVAKSIQAAAIYTQQMMAYYEAHDIENFWNETKRCPSEEQYIDVVQENGKLLNCWVELMRSFKNENDEDLWNLEKLTQKLSVYLQIKEDYAELMDICNIPDSEILSENVDFIKLSFPLIHSINIAPENIEILEFVKYKCLTKLIKLRLENTSSFEYTINKLKMLGCEILEIVQNFGGNPILEKLINDF